TPISPGTTDDITAHVALVTSGFDPVLSGYGINLCRTNTNCMSFGGNAIRLNNNSGGGNITTMRKNVKITDDFFVFSFAAVKQLEQLNINANPLFQVRIYDEEGDLYTQKCILSDGEDCIFIKVPKTNLYYSKWSCYEINTSELIGQWVDIEFSVSDCSET